MRFAAIDPHDATDEHDRTLLLHPERDVVGCARG
jgi:hypothetical protein